MTWEQRPWGTTPLAGPLALSWAPAVLGVGVGRPVHREIINIYRVRNHIKHPAVLYGAGLVQTPVRSWQ